MPEYLEATFDKFIFRVKEGFLYSREGFWASFHGTWAAVGVTDFLQKSSGDITFLKTVEPGSTVKQGDEIGTIETIKAAFGIISPVSGRVIEVNLQLEDKPHLINMDPYNSAWVYRIELSDPEGDTSSLLSALEYFGLMEKLIAQEAKKLNE